MTQERSYREQPASSPAPRRSKIADSVAHQIVRDVRLRGLQRGDRLPPEREMLAQYQVGRGTLREALRYLEFQGVLTIRPGPGGGPVIAGPDSSHLSRMLGLVLQFADATLSDLLDVRLILEPKVAALAAEHIDESGLMILRDSVWRMRADVSDRERFFEENARFHDVIAWASGNPLVGHLVESLHGVVDGANLGAEFPETRRHRVVEAHEQILVAVEAGKPDAAEQAMHEHMLATLKYLRKMHHELCSTKINWDHFSG